MIKIIAKYLSDERGATAVEYGLIGASIAVSVAVVAFVIGEEIDLTFATILAALQS